MSVLNHEQANKRARVRKRGASMIKRQIFRKKRRWKHKPKPPGLLALECALQRGVKA